jgi:hypothetical protein
MLPSEDWGWKAKLAVINAVLGHYRVLSVIACSRQLRTLKPCSGNLHSVWQAVKAWLNQGINVKRIPMCDGKERPYGRRLKKGSPTSSKTTTSSKRQTENTSSAIFAKPQIVEGKR